MKYVNREYLMHRYALRIHWILAITFKLRLIRSKMIIYIHFRKTHGLQRQSFAPRFNQRPIKAETEKKQRKIVVICRLQLHLRFFKILKSGFSALTV